MAVELCLHNSLYLNYIQLWFFSITRSRRIQKPLFQSTPPPQLHEAKVAAAAAILYGWKQAPIDRDASTWLTIKLLSTSALPRGIFSRRFG